MSERQKPAPDIERLFRQVEVTSWRSLVITYRMIFSILESRLAKYDCTISRLQVLLVLYFEGPTVPVRLANRLMVTRGNISTLLKRMQDEELIGPTNYKGTERRPAFQLTPAGRALFEKIYPFHSQNIKELMPELNKNMLTFFADLQEKLYKKYKVGVPANRTPSS